MLNETNVSYCTFSDLEKVIGELTRLQKENLVLHFEIEETKRKVEKARELALFEKKVYSGIKKLFK